MVRSMFTAKPTFDLVCVCVCRSTGRARSSEQQGARPGRGKFLSDCEPTCMSCVHRLWPQNLPWTLMRKERTCRRDYKL